MIVGRQKELARIDALLDDARHGRTQTLVIEGEPGIGKSALLDEVCARATAMRVLRTTAVEAESTVAFAGLDALLRPLLGLLPRLPAPQQTALEGAFALAGARETDVFAVGAGTLSLLAEAAAEQALLVCVDDAHWLDPPSVDALVFAARRLLAEEVAFLLAVRPGESTALDGSFERLQLPPLSRDDARRVLDLRSRPASAASVERLLDLAEGNPLALLELPEEAAAPRPGFEASPTGRVRQAFAARLDLLPDSARLALAAAAVEPDPAAVSRATGVLGLAAEALAAVDASGLARIDADGVRFRHPLVRSLAYASLEPAQRRHVHRVMAQVLTSDADGDRRAWHLGAAATTDDEHVAALLEETAERARSRGGNRAAADALERAAHLSSDSGARARRLTAAARSAFWAGDAARAIRLAEDALESATSSSARADALLELASIRGTQGVPYDEARFTASLAGLEDLDPDRQTRLLITIVLWRSQALDGAGAAEGAARVETVARSAGPWWGPRGLATAAAGYLALGDTDRFWSLMEEVLPDDAATANMALDLVWAERYAEARHALEVTLREGRASGNQMRIIWNQACLAHLELRLGRLSECELAASEAIVLGEAHGMISWVAVANSALASAHAWRGASTESRETAASAIADARATGSLVDELAVRTAFGLVAAGAGDWEAVAEELADAELRWRDSTFVEPSAAFFVPDLVEAYARLGDGDTAQIVLAHFERNAARSARRWALAAAARCRGLLAAGDAFDEPFRESLRLLEAAPTALERARTQLAYGERLRRAGRRRDARVQLRSAHETFAAAGATPWAERAAAELSATGATARPRTPDLRAQLTPQELQIAHLVAEGLTNKEIGARLYLSPKTIEYHLANAYRKLDVHSRVELTRVLS